MRQEPDQSPGKLPSSKQCSSHPKNQECSLVYPQTGNRTNTNRQIDALRQTTRRQATSKKCSNQGYPPLPVLPSSKQINDLQQAASRSTQAVPRLPVLQPNKPISNRQPANTQKPANRPRPPQARQQASTLPSPPQTGRHKKKVRPCDLTLKRRLPTLPQLNAVPSALMGLTSLFGMGRGGTPLL